MCSTGCGHDPPLIVWIPLTMHSKFGASLTLGSGVIVRSKIQTQLYSENVMYYRTLLHVASLRHVFSHIRKLHNPAAMHPILIVVAASGTERCR